MMIDVEAGGSLEKDTQITHDTSVVTTKIIKRVVVYRKRNTVTLATRIFFCSDDSESIGLHTVP